MGMETRGKGLYYYTSSRLNGRVVRKYFGSGAAAIAKAAEVNQVREAARQQRAQVEAADHELAALSDSLDLVATATLENAGFRQHHRGAWRRRRESSQEQ